MGAFFQSRLGQMQAPDWAAIIPIIFFVVILLFMLGKKK